MNKATLLTQVPSIKTETTTRFYQLPFVNPSVVKLEETTTRTIIGDNSPTETVEYSLWVEKNTQKLYGRPTFVKPGFFEVDKKYGFFREYYDRSRPYDEFIVKLNSTEIDPSWGLIFIDISSHRLWSQNFQPIPVLTQITINERDIDLDDNFLNHLKNHPWVVELSEVKTDWYDEYPRDYVYVEVLPDSESLKKIFEQAYPKGYNTKYKNTQGFIYLEVLYNKETADWLGVRPFLK